MYQLQKPKLNKVKKRVGRGKGSGIGKTCGRGQDGQKSRSGSKKRAWFEGGQMPLQRRVPKRGFNNILKKEYQVVNLDQLAKIKEKEIDPELLVKKGLINSAFKRVKILGHGKLSGAVSVTADAFSGSAREKIEKAGGKTDIRKFITRQKKQKENND